MTVELISTLLSFAERAGRLARAIRENPLLFSLLVQEKDDDEKNKKFAQDFKTLADVLIQESLKHYVSLSVSFKISFTYLYLLIFSSIVCRVVF